MQKYYGFDQQFYEYLFTKIVSDGGLRLQIIASDLGTQLITSVNQLQSKYGTKDPLNLYRKQYGNIFEALKAIKEPFFILDNMVIRMKKKEEVRQFKNRIPVALMEKYEKKLVENREKQIVIMKMNNQNQCAVCGQVYNVNVKQPKACSGQPHQPKY